VLPVMVRPVLLVAAALCAQGHHGALAELPGEDLRLGRDVVPVSARVELALDPDRDGYTGVARFALEAAADADSFRLHSRGLVYRSVVLESGGSEIPVRAHPREGELVTIVPDRRLAAGRYALTIAFENRFDERGAGLYKTRSEGRNYIFTQFEAVDARQAFPCWDEPRFKHPWQLEVTIPDGLLAVSNTPVAEESVQAGRRKVLFAETKPLPSYLLALAVGPLETVPIPGLEVPGRIVTTHGSSHLASEAASAVAPALRELERYFGSPYPFEKLDLIAVPEFWYSAMENPGAIVFAERILLLDPRTSGFEERRRMIAILTHELAHMWFGDVVTMSWWDDLWLNESFANWIEGKVTTRVFPELRTDVDQLEGRESAFKLDSRSSARAIRRSVHPMANLVQMADALAYNKGEAVLGMFEQWLGQETFRAGILDYMHTHAWGNARGEDLWSSLSDAAGKDMSGPMESFLDQSGVPLVRAELMQYGRVRLTQRRFLAEGVRDRAENLWQIPVTIRVSNGTAVQTETFLMTGRMQVFTLPIRDPLWIHPNAGERGYYRWEIEPLALLLILDHHLAELDLRERVGLVDNLSALLVAGSLQGDTYLGALRRLAADHEPEVVLAVLRALQQVRVAFATPELEEPFARYVRACLGPAAERFGFEARPDEAPRVTILRPKILQWMADAGRDRNALEQGAAIGRAYLEGAAAMDPAMIETGLALYVLAGGREAWETVRARFESTDDALERQRLLRSLGAVQDSALVRGALDYSLTGPLRAPEIFVIAGALEAVPRIRSLVSPWMIENYEAIMERIPEIHALAIARSADGCSESRLEEVRRFLAAPEHQSVGIVDEMTRVSESVGDCARLAGRQGGAVAAYLASLPE
jgi:alanyl aminopeptidase